MKRFKDILCVVETGEACKPALELAVKLGQETLDYLKPRTHLMKGFARKDIPVEG